MNTDKNEKLWRHFHPSWCAVGSWGTPEKISFEFQVVSSHSPLTISPHLGRLATNGPFSSYTLRLKHHPSITNGENRFDGGDFFVGGCQQIVVE